MGDYISREAAIKSTWMILEGMGYPRSENRSLERTVEAVFKSAPAADVVEVVRCKDCVHSNRDGTICHRGIGRVTNPMGYCHNGAKMDGKGEG